MTKKERPRINAGRIFNPTDPVLDSFENGSNTARQPDKSIGVQQDTLKKLTFQVRDSLYRQLIVAHSSTVARLGSEAPDREVMVEEAIARLIENLQEWEEDIVSRQITRQQELESGALINPSSRKRK